MTTTQVPLTDLQPPEMLYRSIQVLYWIGTGMSQPTMLYEVRCTCSAWTTAHGKFCAFCGQAIVLPDELQPIIYPPPPPPEPPPVPGSFDDPKWRRSKVKVSGGASDFNNDARIQKMGEMAADIARRRAGEQKK